MTPRPPRRDDAGQASLLIVGFAVVLMLTIAVVVDASAAFLRHQRLDSLADGAALSGADAGATGVDVYTGGLADGRIAESEARARAGVQAYLAAVGAYRDFPGLQVTVSVRDQGVTVRLSAPVDLPLGVPGSPDHARVSATGSAQEHLD